MTRSVATRDRRRDGIGKIDAFTAWNTLAFDAGSESAKAVAGTSHSWSHTCSGVNRCLYVGLSFNGGSGYPTNVSVTYNGVAMTKLYGTSGSTFLYLFRLVNPASGVNTISVTWTTNCVLIGGGASFAHVNQVTPDDVVASASGSSTTPSVNVNSAVGDIVVCALRSGQNAEVAEGAGQTEAWDLATAGGGAPVDGAGSYKSGAAVVTMSYTTTNTSWEIAGVSINPD